MPSPMNPADVMQARVPDVKKRSDYFIDQIRNVEDQLDKLHLMLDEMRILRDYYLVEEESAS